MSRSMLSLGYSYDFKLFLRVRFRISTLSGVSSRIQLERVLSSFPFHWMNLIVFMSSHSYFVDLGFWFPRFLTLLSESRLDWSCHRSHSTGFHRWGEGWGAPGRCSPGSTRMISIYFLVVGFGCPLFLGFVSESNWNSSGLRSHFTG